MNSHFQSSATTSISSGLTLALERLVRIERVRGAPRDDAQHEDDGDRDAPHDRLDAVRVRPVRRVGGLRVGLAVLPREPQRQHDHRDHHDQHQQRRRDDQRLLVDADLALGIQHRHVAAAQQRGHDKCERAGKARTTASLFHFPLGGRPGTGGPGLPRLTQGWVVAKSRLFCQSFVPRGAAKVKRGTRVFRLRRKGGPRARTHRYLRRMLRAHADRRTDVAPRCREDQSIDPNVSAASAATSLTRDIKNGGSGSPFVRLADVGQAVCSEP